MTGSSILHRTRSFCCDCEEFHEAALRVDAGAVFFDVACPRHTGQRTVLVSSNAQTFDKIRRKGVLSAPPLESARSLSWANFLEITKECNSACAICYSDAGKGAGGELSVDEAIGVARKLKEQRCPAVTLSGGEPTLHPGLIEIATAIRRLPMDVTIASNGLLLGLRPDLARQIRRAGVTYVYVQFDTLRGEVCRKMRGDDYVEVKKRALDHLKRSGLYFGITTTVVRDNLEEVGDVLRFAAAYLPHLAVVGFLSAAPAGRFTLPEDALVNREDVIDSLVRSGAVEGLTADHFWPFPRFAPFGLDVHPDCAALLYLGAENGRLRPLERYVDIGRVYRLMRRHHGRFNRWWGFFLLSLYFVLSMRLRGIWPVLKMQIGMLLQRGRSAMMVVSVEQFLGRVYQDQERLDRCTTCNVQRDGSRVSTCVFEHPDARRSPLSRISKGAEGGHARA